MYILVADIYDSVSERVEPLGLDCQCLGGGRILTSAANKTIEVFGYSIVCIVHDNNKIALPTGYKVL